MDKKIILVIILMIMMISAFIVINVTNSGEPDQGIYQYRTLYVGNNSAVVNIACNLEYPDKLKWNGTELQTEMAPYGATIYFIDESDAERAWEDSTKMFEVNACTIFSLIENVDNINFVIETKDKQNEHSFSFERQWAEDLIGKDLWKATETEASFDALYKEVDAIINQ